MIYTTYFAKLKSLPKNIIPISICLKPPVGYKGLEYRKLAPKYGFFSEWKHTQDNTYYIDCFLKQVLAGLSPIEVVNELYTLAYSTVEPGTEVGDIALVCYEKSTDFCHRHLVSAWLHNNGFASEEYR